MLSCFNMIMSSERCASCIGERRIACDSIRQDVAGKLALLGEVEFHFHSCNDFGNQLPACVAEAASELTSIGCDIPAPELVKQLNEAD